MLGFGIMMEIGRLLNDDGVSKAIQESNTDINYGLMNRLRDFDKTYNLKAAGLNREQRAISALYLVCGMDDRLSYVREAVVDYSAKFGGDDMLGKAEIYYATTRTRG